MLRVCGSSRGSGFPRRRDGSEKFRAESAGSRYYRIARDPEVLGIPRLVSGYKHDRRERGNLIFRFGSAKTRTRSGRKPGIGGYACSPNQISGSRDRSGSRATRKVRNTPDPSRNFPAGPELKTAGDPHSPEYYKSNEDAFPPEGIPPDNNDAEHLFISLVAFRIGDREETVVCWRRLFCYFTKICVEIVSTKTFIYYILIRFNLNDP